MDQIPAVPAVKRMVIPLPGHLLQAAASKATTVKLEAPLAPPITPAPLPVPPVASPPAAPPTAPEASPPTKKRKSTGPIKAVPLEMYNTLAKELVDSENAAITAFAQKFKKEHPGPSQRQIVESINVISVKERRGSDKRVKFYIREPFLHLLEGIPLKELPFDPHAIPSSKNKGKKKAAAVGAVGGASGAGAAAAAGGAGGATLPGGSKTNEPAALSPAGKGPPVVTVNFGAAAYAAGMDSGAAGVTRQPQRSARVVPVAPLHPSSEAFLNAQTRDTAVALCCAIEDSIAAQMIASPPTPSAPPAGKLTPIDWATVAASPHLKATGLSTPIDCQRLWKFIAYAQDLGDVATTLAPDSDDEAPHQASI